MSLRNSSEKQKVFKSFSKQSKTTDENNSSVNRFTADAKYENLHSKTDGQYKVKRLKTRKERSQMRGVCKETSKTKPHHHQCHRQSNKDVTHFHNCCHSRCHCPSRRAAPFLSVVPAAQEPSIITDSRLIGHHGLFNHEVKSIDFERLLSEQRKEEHSRGRVKERNDAALHLSSTPQIPAPISRDGLSGTDTEVVVKKKKADSATKTHDDCQENKKKNPQFNSQGTAVTPRQSRQQQLDLSSGSFKSDFFSKQGSLSVRLTKTNEAKYVPSERDREAQLTPIVGRDSVKTLDKKVKRCMISTSEQTPKNQKSPVHQMQTCSLSPSPFQLSSSPTADSCDIQHRRQDPQCVSKFVSTVATRLCDSLQFPLLRRRNLVSESREVLLKSLQERHGPWLQENLLAVKQCLSLNVDSAKAVQGEDQESTMIDEDELLPADTPFKISGSCHFNWMSTPQPYQSPEQFYMDFEASGVSASDLFAPSPTECRGGKASTSERWEDTFNSSKNNKSVTFDLFEDRIMNHTTAVRERSSRSQYWDSNIQPFFSDQAQLPDRYSAEPVFPQEQDSFVTASSFPAQIHHSHRSNYFQPFSQFSQPSACSPLRSHPTDMMHYPPSHMLERSPAPSFSSFPSPEHWSFPPMRLY